MWKEEQDKILYAIMERASELEKSNKELKQIDDAISVLQHDQYNVVMKRTRLSNELENSIKDLSDFLVEHKEEIEASGQLDKGKL